jgi:hypothetical protein
MGGFFLSRVGFLYDVIAAVVAYMSFYDVLVETLAFVNIAY